MDGDGQPGPAEGYADQYVPLRAYGALTAAFNLAFVGALVGVTRRGHELPERVGWDDVALVGVATHKLTRLIAKDRVTSVLRAPFTRRQGDAGHGEVEDAARGRGLQRAVGELLVCPYCLGLWIAAGFGVGLVAAPRATRLGASVLASLTVADVLQIAYHAAEERS